MEMWIFLAAAGSGYLAKCWQDFHKNRDTHSHSHSHSHSPVNNNGDSRPRNKSSRDKGKWAACRRSSKCSNPHNADADTPNTSNQDENGASSSFIAESGGRENNWNVNSRKHHAAGDVCLENPGNGESATAEEPVMVVENIDMLANNYMGEFGFGDDIDIPKERGYGRRRRRRALRAANANRPPLNSFDSCLITQINEDNHEFDKVFSTSFLTSSLVGSQSYRQLLVTDGTGIVSRGGIDPLLLPLPFPYPSGDCENISKSEEDESAIGLPCHPLKPNGTINIQSTTSHSLKNAGLMTLKRRRVSKHDPPPTSGLESRKHFTYQDTSAGFILFSFGVGIGVMSTIMSSRKEIQRLTFLLGETEELVEDLEEELEMRDSWTVKDLSGEAPACSDTWQKDAFPVGLSNEVGEADERIYDKDCVKEREAMTSVEAELEAELEKLELNFPTLKHHRNVSGLSEIDPDCIADVITGELKEDGLMHNAESVEDESASTHEEFNKGNFSVSPRDLERRLHEVIETRLQERIIELEAELEASKKKLLAIELGQQKAKELSHKLLLNPDSEELDTTSNYLENETGLQAHKMNSSKAYTNLLVEQKKNGQFISKELLGGFGNGMPDGCYSRSQGVNLTRADCGEFDVQNIEEVASKEHETPPLFLSLSGDALSTYNEVYDEFMKMTWEEGTSALDSAPVKDNELSKESDLFDNCDCYEDDAGKYILHAEPFPLLSTTCWNGQGLGSSGSQASCSSIELQSLARTDLEFQGIGLKNSDFSESLVEDTSGSTPCSLKFVDMTDLINSDCYHQKCQTMTRNVASKQDNYMINVNTSSRPDGSETMTRNVASKQENHVINVNTLFGTDGSSCSGVNNVEVSQLQWSYVQQTHNRGKESPIQHVDDFPGVSKSVVDKIRSWGSTDIDSSSSKSLSLNMCHLKMPDSMSPALHDPNPALDESDYSEDHEQLSKLLIKRIVEKTKEGFPIVQEAESMVSFLD